MDDIDRIEVICGPGATLWGANAMNGVINIITRRAQDTAGHAGARRRRAPRRRRRRCATAAISASGGAFRVYAKWFDRGPTRIGERRERRRSTGTSYRRAFAPTSAAPARNRFTVQGDYQTADENFWCIRRRRVQRRQPVRPLGTRRRPRADTRCRCTSIASIASSRRPAWRSTSTPTTSTSSSRADVGARHQLMWGLGRRYNDYDTVNNDAGLRARPPHARAHQRVRAGHASRSPTSFEAHRRHQVRGQQLFGLGRRCRTCACRGRRTTRRCCGSRGSRADPRAHAVRYRRAGVRRRRSSSLLGDPDFRPEEGDGLRARLSRQSRLRRCRGPPASSTTSTTTCARSNSRRSRSSRCAGAISWRAAPMASRPGRTCR